jgi:hypothetical protein
MLPSSFSYVALAVLLLSFPPATLGSYTGGDAYGGDGYPSQAGPVLTGQGPLDVAIRLPAALYTGYTVAAASLQIPALWSSALARRSGSLVVLLILSVVFSYGLYVAFPLLGVLWPVLTASSTVALAYLYYDAIEQPEVPVRHVLLRPFHRKTSLFAILGLISLGAASAWLPLLTSALFSPH